MTDTTEATKTDVAKELTEDEAKEIAGGGARSEAASNQQYSNRNDSDNYETARGNQ